MEAGSHPIDPKAVYTPDEAAKILKLGRSTVLKLARRGDIRCVRCGAKVVRFYGAALIDFMESGGATPPVNAIPDQVRRRPALRRV